MLFNQSLLSIILTIMLFSLTSCNEAEFYEKQVDELGSISDPISTPGVPVEPTDPPVQPPVDPPVQPPVDPPVQPPVDPPVQPPVDPPVQPPVDPPVYYENIDDFTQNSEQDAKVDILWVIDDSGSMINNQRELGENFDAFINEFIQRDVDFRMAITTTDGGAGHAGNMIGDWTKLTTEAAADDENEFLDYFNSTVVVGTDGSAREQGLYTAKRFLERFSSDWMRGDDAYLIIVVLSDEEEQSNEDTQYYHNYFSSLKSNPGQVKVNSIVTFNESDSWFGDDTIGQKYIDLSAMTNGVSADITTDFHSTLTNMGGKIVDLIDSFVLSVKPVENSIIVRVNGTINNNWVFDEGNRTIHFNANSVPEQGSQIEITYQSLEQGS